METESIPSCTDFVHIGRSYYVFSRALPLIQSCTPTNSPFELRAQLASTCTISSCVWISNLLLSWCCSIRKSTVVLSVPESPLCAHRSIAYRVPESPLCAHRSIAYRTPSSPLDYHFEKSPQPVYSPASPQSVSCTPVATYLPAPAFHVLYCKGNAVLRMLCSFHVPISAKHCNYAVVCGQQYASPTSRLCCRRIFLLLSYRRYHRW